MNHAYIQMIDLRIFTKRKHIPEMRRAGICDKYQVSNAFNVRNHMPWAKYRKAGSFNSNFLRPRSW